jgi:hypothetical protein
MASGSNTPAPARAAALRGGPWSDTHAWPVRAAFGIVLGLACPLAAQPGVIVPTTVPAGLADDPRMGQWRAIFFWAVVLLLILLVAAGVIIRFSRRYRAYLMGGRPLPPTPDGDVWQMHRLPDEPAEPPPPPPG